MMHRPPAIVLDACVLADFIISDLLLRMAEDPVIILPRWSDEIFAEVRRTHRKLKWSDDSAESWQQAVRSAFPESFFEPPREIVAVTPDDFLCQLYKIHPDLMSFKITDMAQRQTPKELIAKIKRNAPKFAEIVERDK